jgi:hypothetical protein
MPLELELLDEVGVVLLELLLLEAPEVLELDDPDVVGVVVALVEEVLLVLEPPVVVV